MRYAVVPSVLFVVCLLTALPVLAGDGAIPIWEPMTITEPGHYVVTRNITAPDAIMTILGIADVHIDLNGFTLESTSSGNAVYAIGASELTVRNGTIKVADLWVGSSPHVVIEDIKFEGGGIRTDLSTDSMTIRRNLFRNSSSYAIECTACGGGAIVDNKILGSGLTGIWVQGEGGRLVGNVVVEAGTSGYPGIELRGSGWLVRDNVVQQSGHAGILSFADRFHLERNVLVENAGYGLYFFSFAEDNLYRGNTARGNGGSGCTGTASAGDLCDEGTGNTSHGDNYMPTQM